MPFLGLTIALLTIGLIMLFSASYPYAYYYKDSSYYYFIRQILFAVAGLVAMLLMSKINYKILKAIYKPVFVVTIALLVIVLFHHTNVQNFKRWIPLGPVTIQPSDLAKFTIILTLAVYISKYYKKMKTMKYGILIPIGIIAIFCGLIYLEHHLSCTILMFFIGACLMFAGGSDWKLFAFGLAVIVLLGFLVVSFPTLIENYAGKRIVAWLDKDYDPLNGRWQTNNSLYAIGSGGFFGVGLGNSKQKYLYVSEPQNDFIFSIVCEELGFLGAAIIIALFAALVIRGLIIASRCKDKFGSLLIIGIVAQIGLQVVLNILVVTDTLPNTGFAFPFFSYGGTAIFMLLFEIGVVLSISRKTNQQKV
ncbi:MAG: FtsW/RodA/SpoVE family cell cycle protein [Eubacterium sp.]|nr:FtsW/RodA/SpoVE family cell cycle protein [Eubacterium sp.]MBP8775321.1 FtsW/RodA/SpoVE family cell cycle protein [Eubacterium sp.]MBS6900249.1 FtsW/RodA/SpoVE family cell cycle protein [Eubacterium sp.]